MTVRNRLVSFMKWTLGVPAFVLCSSLATAGVISATNSTTGNFDESSGTRVVTFTGLEPGYDTGVVTDVNISINFAKADGEGFFPPYPGGTPFYKEIRFRLTDVPSAITSTLIEAGSWGAGSGHLMERSPSMMLPVLLSTSERRQWRELSGLRELGC